MFRVFIVLSIPLALVTYFQYDLSFSNKFFYSLENLSQTLVIFWCIYLISLLVSTNIRWLKRFIKSSSIDFIHKYYLGKAIEHNLKCDF